MCKKAARTIAAGGLGLEKASLLRRQALQFIEPEGGAGIAGHAPIAPGREGDRTHLGAIRQAAALKLLGKKAPVKGAQPMEDSLSIVRAGKGIARQAVNLGGRKGPADGIVKKEIVQGIGAYQLFGFLDDLSLRCGQQRKYF